MPQPDTQGATSGGSAGTSTSSTSGGLASSRNQARPSSTRSTTSRCLPGTGGAQVSGVALREVASARIGERAILIKPELFLDPACRLDDLPLSFRRRDDDSADGSSLRAALEILAAHDPDLVDTTLDHLRVVAFKDVDENGFDNLSHNDLPDASILSRSGDPFDLAETLVHEAHHHRLFAIEIDSPMFAGEGSEPFTDARFDSPWRDEPRPLYGILHGVYVHLPVWRLWRSIRERSARGSSIRERADDRLTQLARELEIGAAELRSGPSWSPFGDVVVSTLAEETTRIASATSRLR